MNHLLPSAGSPAEGNFYIPPSGVGLELLPLIVGLSSAPDPDEHFHATVLEVHLERDEGQALLKSLGGKRANLAAVEEEFPPPLRLVVELLGFFILGDVAAEEPDLVSFHPTVGLVEAYPPGSQALDLAADQRDATLHRVQDLEVVAGLPVFSYDLFRWFLRLGPGLPGWGLGGSGWLFR